MFDDCYLRLGKPPFTSCVPLTVNLLASLYALPERVEVPLRGALEGMPGHQPWSESLAVAPDQTASSVGAMLRQVALATEHLDPVAVDAGGLPDNSRARAHLGALLGLWQAHPEVLPSDLRKLGDLLTTEAGDVLQPVAVIQPGKDAGLSPLERKVLAHLEAHHGSLGADDADHARLIAARAVAAAPAGTLLGHVQRNLLDPAASPCATDDTMSVLSVRDCLGECEAAVAIIQRWLAVDSSLRASDIALIVPIDGVHASYLAGTFRRAGLVASSMPAPPATRSVGAETVLHFLQCRRRPAPAMALASLYSSPVLCWSPEVGSALACGVMQGDFAPAQARDLADRPARLFSLIRSASPTTNSQLKENLRRFQTLLSEDEALRGDVRDAKRQVARLIAAIGGASDKAEPDWERLIQTAAAYQPAPAVRGDYHLGGITVMQAHERPKRSYRKLVVLGFNAGAYPGSPSGNPFFLDSELTLIREMTGLEIPSQAGQLDAALSSLNRQFRAASEQLVLLLSERDRLGSSLSPSSSLALVARLVEGVEDPEKLVTPASRSAGTIWDRLLDWRKRPEFKSLAAFDVPANYELGVNLLTLRRKEDGTPRAQSPSRLEKLLVSPLAWLLGELGAAHVPWQPEKLDVMLRGSLAHEVFERLFVPGHVHPDDDAIEERVPALLVDRIRAIAPFLQSPAWVVERTALESEIIASAKHWSMVLTSLGAEIVGNEFWLSGDLFGHPVHGKADCLLRLPDGQPVVVDYKKSSSGARRQRLQKSWDLQVDLYRRMDVREARADEDGPSPIAQALSAWGALPAVAYHTLNDGNVLINGLEALDSDHVEVVRGDIAEKALALVKARFDALAAGRVGTNTTADEAYFRTAALGTYALNDSPLIAAFTREDAVSSADIGENSHD
ncbi:MAG: PD-(D/E)XK nuclease family protein [Sphingomonadales bacterium]|nr:PD-(D/E)XK nuclease family protein [Sphingomonadales bacterium]MDE2171544.1 PD-(D/E)XK nuclease family protein [Sphingomonadales bacterium]